MLGRLPLYLRLPCGASALSRPVVRCISVTAEPGPVLEDINSTARNVDGVNYKSEFMRTMYERGYLHQCTSPMALDMIMAEKKISAYLGFDATARSLHVGSLVQLMILRLLQKTGHTPIILVGGGTSKVGDPSGKDKSRQLLSAADIDSNITHMSTIFRTFVEFNASNTCTNPATILNNAHWLNKLNYIDFLRDYGRYFSVNRMLTFDSVKTRLAREEPLSFLEFNYMVLQAYDFKYIHERYGAILQIGGSDQWGNMVSGTELVRKAEQVHLHGLTAPLITTSDGKKMGKSESGAIWLNKALLSEFDYWQFWRNIADTDVNRFLKLFTELPISEIEALTEKGGAALNAAKIVLADEATKILHGEECLSKIHRSIGSLYANAGELSIIGDADEDADEVYDEDEDPMDALPIVSFASRKILISYAVGDDIRVGVDVGEALMLSRLSASRGEGRRLIKGGGVKVNDVKVEDQFMILEKSHFFNKGRVKLSVGKKRHVAFSVPEEVWADGPLSPVKVSDKKKDLPETTTDASEPDTPSEKNKPPKTKKPKSEKKKKTILKTDDSLEGTENIPPPEKKVRAKKTKKVVE